jgi:ferredoxin-NADP reductase
LLSELTKAEQENPNFTLVGTMTEMERSGAAWNGEAGYIGAEMIAKFVSDLDRPIFYISGPETLVAAMRKVLDELGVKDDKIRTEEFSGY